MQVYIAIVLAIFFTFNSGFAGPLPPEQSGTNLQLWFRQPAAQWTEALPVGNGRLGAMVFGGVSREHLQLNLDTLWAGGPYDSVNPDALAALPEVRRLIFAGHYAEAADLLSAKVMAKRFLTRRKQ